MGDSGWLEKGELGVVPEVMREKDIRDLSECEGEKKRGGLPRTLNKNITHPFAFAPIFQGMKK